MQLRISLSRICRTRATPFFMSIRESANHMTTLILVWLSAIPLRQPDPMGADGRMASPPSITIDDQNARSIVFASVAPMDPAIRHGEILREWASVYRRTTNRAFRDHFLGAIPYGYTGDLITKQYSDLQRRQW
jgi:hypothetical protein